MKTLQPFLAVMCAFLVAAPSGLAQSAPARNNFQDDGPRVELAPQRWYSRFTQRYQGRSVLPANYDNSTRMDSLLRAGNLYLSLQDAVALALENNIDIEVQRYGALLAETALGRAQAGGTAQNTNTAATAGAAGVGGAAGGAGAGGNNVAAGGGAAGGGAAGTAAVGGGNVPSFDPVLTSTLNWGHVTTPQNNTVTTGTTSLINTQKVFNFGVSQGFKTGGQYQLTFNNNSALSNAPLNSINPVTNSFLDLQVTQPLLQGFGLALNTRNIRVAQNNVKVNEQTFTQQVINTVNNVSQLYWNLVSFKLDVEAKKLALSQSSKLLSDNRKQVEIGTLAPISVVQAEAEVASRELDLLTSETNVLQQETILKNAISRTGLANPLLSEARIIPTDRIRMSEVEPIAPIQDLVQVAVDRRPDLFQTRIQLENSKINLTGTKNALKPQLNFVAQARNTGLTGERNILVSGNTLPAGFRQPDPFFIGGYGNVLGQIIGRNFPNYSVGVTLNVNLRNRQAQADYTTAQLQLRQSELQYQRTLNQVRVDIQNALTAVQQARMRYQSANKARTLQEQTLDAEQKKLDLGASTTYQVLLIQRDLATARQNEVTALTAYGLAKLQMDVATGMLLERNNVQIDEARSGHVSRGPDPIVDTNR